MKDLRYIIKRILIGVGIGVCLMLIKGNLFLGVSAEELITRQPLSIGILADHSYNQYSIISNTGWDGHDVWSPGTPSNDWGGTARFDYNYTGGNYCTQTQNYGTLSGIFYNASTSLNPGVVVKFLYTNTSSEFTCSTNLSGNKGTFSCTGIDFTKNFSLLIYNANPGYYGLVKQLGYTCEASIGSQIQNDNQNTQNIINNNNQNTQNIINNNNQNTQAIIDSQNQINGTLNNDNVDGANSQAGSFFNGFQSNSHGLSGVITSPLRLINSLTTASCSPLQFQLPFVHNQVSLPCMRSIYENHFGVFFSLYQLITTGLISYLVMINFYSKLRNLQNPNNDRIEVLNL